MAGEAVIVGKLVYEIGETGLAQLKSQLAELAAKPISLKVDAGGGQGFSRARQETSELEKQINSLQNFLRGTINTYKAVGGEVDSYVAKLTEAKDASEALSQRVSAESNEFARLTAVMAQAEAATIAALNPKQSSKGGTLDAHIRQITNDIASMRNMHTATGADVSAGLDAMRARALDLASTLRIDSDEYKKLTAAAASAQRGITAQLKSTIGETNPLQAAIAKLQNEVNGLRNQYIATGGESRIFAAGMQTLRDNALQLADGLAQDTKEFRQLMTVAAQAERAATSATGGMSRLGLASQVQRGTIGLGPRLYGVAGAAEAASFMLPGRVGMTAYFARPLIGQLTSLGPALGVATGGALAFAGALGYGAAQAAKLQQQQTFLEAITGQNKGAYDELTNALQNLSTELPVSATDLYATATAAAQLGVDGVRNLTDFTKVVQELALVTQTDASQIGEDLAKFLNETGITSNMPGYIDALNQTANALAAVHINTAATASSTLTLARYFASIASQVGLTRPEIIALSGALSSLGAQAQSGGMQLSRFFLQMAQDAQANNAQLRAMALIAGQDTDAFRKLVQTNPVQAFVDLAKGLQAAHGNGAQFAQAMAAIGAKNERLIRTLGEASVGSQNFFDALDTVNGALDKQGYLDGIVSQATNNLSDQWTITKSDFNDLLSILGKTVDIPLLGVVKELNAFLKSQIDVLQSLIASYETWTDVILSTGPKVAGVIGGLTGAAGGAVAGAAVGSIIPGVGTAAGAIIGGAAGALGGGAFLVHKAETSNANVPFADFKADYAKHLAEIQGQVEAAVASENAPLVKGAGLDLGGLSNNPPPSATHTTKTPAQLAQAQLDAAYEKIRQALVMQEVLSGGFNANIPIGNTSQLLGLVHELPASQQVPLLQNLSKAQQQMFFSSGAPWQTLVGLGSDLRVTNGLLQTATQEANAKPARATTFYQQIRPILASLGAPLFHNLLTQSRIAVATGTPFDRVKAQENAISDAIKQIEKLGAQSGATTNQIDAATGPLYKRLEAIASGAKDASDAQHKAATATNQFALTLVDKTAVASSALSAFAQAASKSGNAFIQTASDIASGLKFNANGGLDIKGSIVSVVTNAASFIASTFGDLISTTAESLKAQSQAYLNIGPGKDVLSIGQTFSDYRNASTNRANLDQQFADLAHEKRIIDERTIGGTAGGAAAGAAIGSVIPGIGTLIGAAIGALLGGHASNDAAKRALEKQMNDTQTRINDLTARLHEYTENLRKSLGLTADDFANGIQSAFSSVNLSGFKTKLSDAVNSIIRNALVDRFVGDVLNSSISDLSKHVFLAFQKDQMPNMTTVKADMKTIIDKSSKFYDVLNKLGLAASGASSSLNSVSASSKNLPDILKIAAVRFQSAHATGGTVGDVHVHVQGNVYGVNDLKRVVAQGVAEYQARTGLRTVGNVAYAGGTR